MSNFENFWICNRGEKAIFVREFKIFSSSYSDNEIKIVLTSISSISSRKNLSGIISTIYAKLEKRSFMFFQKSASRNTYI
jgi:hypothetical protein